jgi:hypothetical protein
MNRGCSATRDTRARCGTVHTMSDAHTKSHCFVPPTARALLVAPQAIRPLRSSSLEEDVGMMLWAAHSVRPPQGIASKLGWGPPILGVGDAVHRLAWPSDRQNKNVFGIFGIQPVSKSFWRI